MVIFGSTRQDSLIIEAYLNGFARLKKGERAKQLVSSGLAVIYKDVQEQLALNAASPVYQELRKLLKDLTGKPGKAIPSSVAGNPTINPDRPLGHFGKNAFRIILSLVRDGKQSLEKLRLNNADMWPTSVDANLESLIKDKIIVKHGADYSIASALPASFAKFVLAIGEYLGKSDPRFAPGGMAKTSTTAAFQKSDDNAPLLFASAVRLRTLMALAKYGPMNVLDLRRSIGGTSVHIEDDENAPFTRANVVRTWQDDKGTNVMLDPQYPLYLPLRRLLLKLEEHYPVLPLQRRYPKPKLPPKLEGWRGDRLALFGGPIPTSILTSIAPMGWTFETLCCAVATGYDRVVVKKSLKRLEADGIVQGDRARKPGFNVRVVTIADSFPARDELNALLKAYSRQWSQVKTSVEVAMNQLPPRTKEHLRRRKLWFDK